MKIPALRRDFLLTAQLYCRNSNGLIKMLYKQA